MSTDKTPKDIEVNPEPEVVSNCCSGRIYAPTKDYAQCLTCYEYCDPVTTE